MECVKGCPGIPGRARCRRAGVGRAPTGSPAAGRFGATVGHVSTPGKHLVSRRVPRKGTPAACAPRQLRIVGRALKPALLVLLGAISFCRAGTLAQFRTVYGDIDVELYEQDKPVTTQNLIHYVQSGAYQNMFLHRCDPGFVIQGGGFYVANRSTTNQFINAVTNFGAIINEFGVGRRFSNVYGTIAMAKVAGNTNSASSQWFFNLQDNLFLDTPDTNNLFVVFGHVVGGTNVLNTFNSFSGASPTNTIADFRAVLGGAFGELPLLTTNATYDDLIYVDVSLLNVHVRATDIGAREISWNSVSNRLNRVEFTQDFPPTWQLLVSTNGTGGMLTAVDADRANTQRFYRVRVEY